MPLPRVWRIIAGWALKVQVDGEEEAGGVRGAGAPARGLKKFLARNGSIHTTNSNLTTLLKSDLTEILSIHLFPLEFCLPPQV